MPLPPYSCGKGMPIRPSAGELLHDLVREPVLAVELLRDRPHLLVGELPHQALDVALLVCEIEVQARASVVGPSSRLGSRRFARRWIFLGERCSWR